MTGRGPRLRLVCVNDVYALEHLPRLRTLVERERTCDPADTLLVILAGDFLSPNMLTSLDAGAGMVDCMNGVPFTHVVLGNHEDDLDPAHLRARLAELSAVCLGANVSGLDMPASDIVVVGGPSGRRVRVALVGSVTDDHGLYRRVPFGARELRPANEATRRELERLRLEHRYDAAIAITHQSLADDRALAPLASSLGLALVVGGHEHEPVEEHRDGLMTIKAGRDAETPFVVDLEWPADDVAPTELARPTIAVRVVRARELDEAPALRARVAAHLKKLEILERATLRRLGPGETLSSVGARRMPTSLGTLLASMLRDGMGAEGALLNGGAIRAGRDYDERFTYADLRAEVPFDNDVVVVELPGAVLVEAVCASRAAAPRETGGYLHVDDRMRMGPGDQVEAVAGEPLDPARRYRIATVRNFFFGLDRIEPLVRFAAAHPEAIPAGDAGREVKMILVEAFLFELFDTLGPFSRIDLDGSCHLDAGEIGVALERATSEPASPLTVEMLIRTLDADGDGAVSATEAARPRSR